MDKTYCINPGCENEADSSRHNSHDDINLCLTCWWAFTRGTIAGLESAMDQAKESRNDMQVSLSHIRAELGANPETKSRKAPKS